MKQPKDLRHRVTVRSGRTGLGVTAADRTFIRHCVYKALEQQKVGAPCEVDILLSDDEALRELNRDFRQLDKPTDVLSFPAFDLTPGVVPKAPDDAPDGFFPLGDIAISWPRAQAQAEEYQHSLQRELGFLTVHGVLHLLGYDHADDASEADMKQRAEATLSELDLARTGESPHV